MTNLVLIGNRHLDLAGFLAYLDKLMNTCGGDIKVGKSLRAKRKIDINGIVGCSSRIGHSATLESVAGISQGGNRITHNLHEIYRRVLRVLTEVRNAGYQLTFDPLTIVLPTNNLHLVMHLTCELQRRLTQHHAVTKIILEGIRRQGSCITINLNCCKLGIVDKAEILHNK